MKRELIMTNINKDVAVSFLTLVISGKVREAYSKSIGIGFRHHNLFFEGSAESLMAGMEENAHQNPNKVLEVKHTIAEDDFVVIHSHIRQKPEDPGAAVVHIFRFDEYGQIVELWDLGQAVAEKTPNQYGMF
jgi:predicted SnoaL-like aldol condensation-catalyzing enzyme